MPGPLTRKSPVEHKVRKHKRMGKDIDEFTRGQGQRETGPVRSRPKKIVQSVKRGGPLGGDGEYRVRLVYVDHNPEKFDFDSTSYQEAQRTGFAMSGNVEHPLQVSIKMIRRNRS